MHNDLRLIGEGWVPVPSYMASEKRGLELPSPQMFELLCHICQIGTVSGFALQPPSPAHPYTHTHFSPTPSPGLSGVIGGQ